MSIKFVATILKVTDKLYVNVKFVIKFFKCSFFLLMKRYFLLDSFHFDGKRYTGKCRLILRESPFVVTVQVIDKVGLNCIAAR